jgi:KDO2-lipid IV(A) lauroyltransferase
MFFFKEKIFKVFVNLLKKIPDKLSFYFAIMLGKILYILSKFSKYKYFIDKNIKNTMHINKSSASIIAQKSIILLTQNIIDFLKVENLNENNISNFISIKNIEYYYEAKNKNKGIIFVSAHYGCWELIGAYLSLFLKNKLSVLVQRPSEHFIDKLFFELRDYLGIKTLYTDNYVYSIKNMLISLDKKECLGFLVDQHGENEKYFVEFFGRYVSVPEISVNLAYRKNIPILPVFISRINKNKHEITFYEPIFINYSKNKDREITDIFQKIYKIIENIIRKKPDEYLWFYERFNKLSSQSIEIALNLELLKKEKLK